MLDLSDSGSSGARAPLEDAAETARRALEALIVELGSEGSDRATADAIADTQRVLDRIAPRGETAVSFMADAGAALVFDISDILAYFPYNRAPTGIQRVVMEVITSALDTQVGRSLHLCRFLKDSDRWVEVPVPLFLDLCAASKAGGDAEAKDWLATFDRLDAASRNDEAMLFRPGAVLVNLGASWWLPNYFLQIRHLKATANIRYVPLIYDMIPAAAPQFCMPALVTEFAGWLTGVFDHADYFLAISEATKRDLIDLAARIGRDIPSDLVGVVPLDADFRGTTLRAAPVPAARPAGARRYVLFVSTFEVRKNQLAAIDAWRAMINEYGIDNVPQLILVGKKGYLGNKVAERVQHDEVVGKRVTLLSGIDDEQLAGLYRNCLFTLYPSAYEGWGLPVTESLCYGKVPLIADNSSLPEAGGDFAVYFATGSQADMLAGLRKLIFDEPYRRKLEQKIAKDFKPRTWRDIATRITSLVETWASQTPASVEAPPIAHRGYYYEMAAGRSHGLWKGMGSAEVFRQGVSWWEMEGWGSWTRPAGGGLRMVLAGQGAARLALQLRGLPDRDCEVEIRSAEGDVLTRGGLHHGSIKWFFVDVVGGEEIVDIRLIGSDSDTETKIDSDGGKATSRKVGVGLKGFFVIGSGDPQARAAFYEAVALGSIHDLSYFRRMTAG